MQAMLPADFTFFSELFNKLTNRKPEVSRIIYDSECQYLGDKLLCKHHCGLIWIQQNLQLSLRL